MYKIQSPSIMSFVDGYPLTSSSVSSFNSISLPKSRIKCNKDQIHVGGSSFQSASDALLVYLQQYDVAIGKELRGRQLSSPSSLLLFGSKRGESHHLDQYLAVADQVSSKNVDGFKSHESGNVTRVAEDVEDLLTSQLCAEVTEAVREVRQQQGVRQAVPESPNHTRMELHHEVEAALLRSAKLLEKLTKEDIPPIRTPTITRKTPGNDSLTHIGSTGADNKPSGHVYSYRSSRHRKTQNPSSMKSLHLLSTQSGELRKCSSIDNLLLASNRLPPRHRHSFNSSSASISHHSDPTGAPRNLRTRSLSPGLRNMTGHLSTTSGLLEQQDQSVRKPVPSWVQELSPSEVPDSLWKSGSFHEDKKDAKPHSDPSRVRNVPVQAVKATNSSYSIKDNDLNSNSGLTAGFNLSDLGLSAIHSSSNHKLSSFLNGTGKEDLSIDKHRVRHSSPIRESLASVYSSPVMPVRGSRTFDREYNGEAVLHRNILPQTARLRKSIDNFVASAEKLKHKTLTSDSSVASSDARCSSLDTLSLLTGKPLSRKDAEAASCLPVDIQAVGQSSSTSSLVPASGHEERIASPVSVGLDLTSDGLDGDRPWEKLAVTFKPPVPVEADDTPHMNGVSAQKIGLSGGKQHGSMETLKNMLFKLQAEENATHKGNNQNYEDLHASQTSNSKPYLDILPALQNYDFQREPGGQSLEKALVHLNRLKELVQSTNASALSGETGQISTTVELPTNDVTH